MKIIRVRAYFGNIALQDFTQHHCCFVQKNFGFVGCQAVNVVCGTQEIDNAARM